jgi:hypothetical protein
MENRGPRSRGLINLARALLNLGKVTRAKVGSVCDAPLILTASCPNMCCFLEGSLARPKNTARRVLGQ